jgi:hypothetical protein
MRLTRLTVPIAAALALGACRGSGDASNRAPFAAAGTDQLVSTGTIVHLDGSASSDPDLDTLTYAWAFTSKPVASAATLVGADGVAPAFAADAEGDYEIQLVVSDGRAASAPSTVLVKAVGAPRPIANAGPDRTAVTGQTTVQLDGSGSYDPDGSALVYTWVRTSFPTGSVAALDANSPSQPTFLPDKSGEYVFRLQVNDGVRVSDWDEVRVLAGAQDAVALVGGSGQSGVVGTALAGPFVAKVTNAYGMAVRNVAVEFAVSGGTGTLSRTTGYTDASGQTTATLTLGTLAGPTTVRATCASCATAANATLTATALPDAPARVVLLEPADAHVGTPMALEAQVQDRYGNRATAESGTRFTVTASGSAAIASAVEGSIAGGAGTATALVQSAAGRVLLNVTDATAETVTFVASDSERNGLAYPGTPFFATAKQSLSCSSPYANTFSFDVSRAGPPSGDATVTVHANGNFDDSYSDYLELLLESTSGTSYGKLYDGSAGLCVQLDRPVTVPLAALQGYVADGKVGVVTRTSGSECIFCSGTYSVAIDLAYPTTTQASFY